MRSNSISHNRKYCSKGVLEDMSCKCQDCGKQYRIDIVVPNEIWGRIKPSGKAMGGGLLCGSCIMARLETLDVYGSYELVESGSYFLRGLHD